MKKRPLGEGPAKAELPEEMEQEMVSGAAGTQRKP